MCFPLATRAKHFVPHAGRGRLSDEDNPASHPPAVVTQALASNGFTFATIRALLTSGRLSSSCARTTKPLQIRHPAFIPVSLRLLGSVGRVQDASSHNNHVHPLLQHRMPRRIVLLTERVTLVIPIHRLEPLALDVFRRGRPHGYLLRRQLNPRRHRQEVVALLLVHRLLRHKPQHELLVLPRQLVALPRVLRRHHVILAAHLRQQQQASRERRARLRIPRHRQWQLPRDRRGTRRLHGAAEGTPRRRRRRRDVLGGAADGGADGHDGALALLAADADGTRPAIAPARARAAARRLVVLRRLRVLRRVPHQRRQPGLPPPLLLLLDVVLELLGDVAAAADLRRDVALLAGERRERRLLQPLHHARPGEHVRVHQVRPARDAERAPRVLRLHGVADVAELAVLEDEELVLAAERRQRRDRALREVPDRVRVRLEQRDVRAGFLGEVDELRVRVHVRAEAEVGGLEGHEPEEVGGQGGGVGERRALHVGEAGGGRHVLALALPAWVVWW